MGSVFSQYLSMWLFSIPITGHPPERFPELARFPLGRMQPAIADCWSAYRKRADLEPSRSIEWLSAAVSYAGARLVQTAFEAAQVSTHLDSSVSAPLTTSLEHPRPAPEAAVHLLGIPIGLRR